MKWTGVSVDVERVVSIHNPVLRVITGPTAAGKSAIAMELARRFNRALISADSRQVYRGFDIGTAKPHAAELREVPHFGVNVLNPDERYSAHAWARDATGWMRTALELERHPLVVGGTGFYIRALVSPLSPAPTLDSERRQRLGLWLAERDVATLQQWCTRLDPARAHLGRTQLLRAIETALLAGTRLGDAHVEHANAGSAPVRYLVVDPGDSLANNIKQRVDAMLSQGWEEEVQGLMDTVPESAPAWLASGYGVMRQYVRGALPRSAAIERIIIETRQYAKRQRTWCRHQLVEGPVTRISPNEPHALDRAIAWLTDTESNVP